jgi:CelD/BcsL family acetyltransferase involved in cellulose biosynthesis
MPGDSPPMDITSDMNRSLPLLTRISDVVDLREWKWTEWTTVVPYWESLWHRSTSQSPFLHPAWVEAWLETFGPSLQPVGLLATTEAGDDALGCCIMTRRVEYVRGMPVRRVYLNTAGENAADDVCVEYNDILARPEYKAEFVAQLIARLKQSRVDQFVVSGVHDLETVNLLRSEWASATTCAPSNAPYVDLASIRRRHNDYERELSSNTRTQVRRSRKLIEAESGAIQVERADTVSQGLEFLQELADLHQLRWTAKGEAGAFHSPRFSAFHRRLVERLLPLGGVDLLRIRAGERTVGILYNYVVQRKVFFYQSGFMYSSNNRVKPGLVTHTEAINYYLGRGFDEYDFLAGDSQYKQSLGNAERQMQWLTFDGDTLRVRFMSRLKTGRSWARRLASEVSRFRRRGT